MKKENVCKNCKGDKNSKFSLKSKFVQAQKIFGKSVPSAEINYYRDKLNDNDPNAF